jgi:hypothetical protein
MALEISEEAERQSASKHTMSDPASTNYRIVRNTFMPYDVHTLANTRSYVLIVRL